MKRVFVFLYIIRPESIVWHALAAEQEREELAIELNGQ